jgi:hypothetical protein
MVGRIVIVALENCQRANQKASRAPCGVRHDFVSIATLKQLQKGSDIFSQLVIKADRGWRRQVI